jgi:NAD(P)-dependent dehydrogenase (short-subunit alcohol dehydrogenase family)
MSQLKDKVAIVTGAGSGIGEAIAIRFANAGAKVIVSDIDINHGNAVVEKIKQAGGTASFVRADTSSLTDNEALVNAALQQFGKLDIAVNNAGIAGPASPVGSYPIDGWKSVIDINLTGVFYGMRAQITQMMKSGGGAIVNISSILGQVGFRSAPAYVAAKHGLVGLTRAAALDHALDKIRVNVVGPAFINTPMLSNNLSADMLAGLATLHPMGRIGEPNEVAELALWLSSDAASFVTGSYYAVDGGYLVQ